MCVIVCVCDDFGPHSTNIIEHCLNVTAYLSIVAKTIHHFRITVYKPVPNEVACESILSYKVCISLEILRATIEMAFL